ncbi:hypothetical protein [Nonomuraea sp. NPDC046570]|uniref:hypothetical protein n=1 Tax=Nonomuraea sp. NPDC046570 TaxID=3155255 RepID=UPI0033C9D71D
MEESVADLIAKAGLPDNTPLKEAMPKLTWYVTSPLKDAQPPITTLGDLSAWSDAALVKLPGFAAGHLTKLKTELSPPGTPDLVRTLENAGLNDVRLGDPGGL